MDWASSSKTSMSVRKGQNGLLQRGICQVYSVTKRIVPGSAHPETIWIPHRGLEVRLEEISLGSVGKSKKWMEAPVLARNAPP